MAAVPPESRRASPATTRAHDELKDLAFRLIQIGLNRLPGVGVIHDWAAHAFHRLLRAVDGLGILIAVLDLPQRALRPVAAHGVPARLVLPVVVPSAHDQRWLRPDDLAAHFERVQSSYLGVTGFLHEVSRPLCSPHQWALTETNARVTILDAGAPDLLQAAESFMETESERIGKLLRDDFDAALLERNSASEAFDEVLRGIPSRLPHPDGAQQIRNTSHALSAAREKMIAAMIRLREFENRGIIPEDLKKKPAQKEGGDWRTQSSSG